MSLQPECLHQREEIEGYLRREPLLHLYELGDLDDFFWPYTTWYGFREGVRVDPIFLIYTGTPLPILLATALDTERMSALLQAASPFLPRRFYAHFSSGLADLFRQDYRVESHGTHLKMALENPSRLEEVDTSRVEQLSTVDLAALERLYAASYPGNWFNPRMLETGAYYGIRQGSEILSVAGVHVYSSRYRAAALGNITTHPDFRGRGLGTQVTARLCQALCGKMEYIGLNVKTDNTPAIASYTKLGFVGRAEYEEFMLSGFGIK